MKFSKLAEYLEKIEKTSKRLEITTILASLISELSAEEIDKAIYLSLGYLKAEYETEKFNMADKMVIRVLDKAYSPKKNIEEIYNELGDLGDVALLLDEQEGNSDLEILDVHKILLEVALLSGSGSQDSKVNKLAQLLSKTNRLSSKYIVRIVLGTTRLGFTELTVADALSEFSIGNKSNKKAVEAKYFIHPDIGKIAKIIKTHGVAGLNKINIETGVPILAQKAQRAGGLEEIVDKVKSCWAEYKFDGSRIQLHFDKDKKFEVESKQVELFQEAKKDDFLIKTFTRNLEDTTHQNPDIVQAAVEQLDARSAILDGEAIGIDRKTGEFLPFQEIMQRKRKHSVKEMSKEIPLQYFAFDILYLNGESLINKPLTERYEILNKVVKRGDVIKVTEHLKTSSIPELSAYFEKAKKMSLEGLIIKNPDKPYEAGARSFSWVKLKKADEKLLEDSIDAVVLGYYEGRGERSKFGIGGFLIGIYDETKEAFVTISKVGTGLKEDDWIYLKKEADKCRVKEKPKNVILPDAYKPDVYVSPHIVVEIGADEVSVSKTHSAGFALRFPRLLFFRKDKKPTQITTLKEIKKLHSLQKRGNYNE